MRCPRHCQYRFSIPCGLASGKLSGISTRSRTCQLVQLTALLLADTFQPEKAPELQELKLRSTSSPRHALWSNKAPAPWTPLVPKPGLCGLGPGRLEDRSFGCRRHEGAKSEETQNHLARDSGTVLAEGHGIL